MANVVKLQKFMTDAPRHTAPSVMTTIQTVVLYYAIGSYYINIITTNLATN